MAAPDFVPTDQNESVRWYQSPPRRPGSWRSDRPGDLDSGQPQGLRLGSPGPDQGYVMTLLKLFSDRLHLGAVSRADAEAGCAAIGSKRAALHGRGPMVHDLTVGFTVFGFLDPNPDSELKELRERLFPQIHSGHHYSELREVVDLVPNETLRQSPQAVEAAYQKDWKANL